MKCFCRWIPFLRSWRPFSLFINIYLFGMKNPFDWLHRLFGQYHQFKIFFYSVSKNINHSNEINKWQWQWAHSLYILHLEWRHRHSVHSNSTIRNHNWDAKVLSNKFEWKTYRRSSRLMICETNEWNRWEMWRKKNKIISREEKNSKSIANVCRCFTYAHQRRWRQQQNYSSQYSEQTEYDN